MTAKKRNIAVFLSGRGSNFEAIYTFSQAEEAPFRVALVISDKKKAPGLETARQWNIPSFFVRPGDFPSREVYETRLISLLETHHVELICLAGFMRIISPLLIRRYPNRIMNIHPSLLPEFPGLDAQKQALEAGVRESGCTVHFVDEGIDSGPVILQRKVPVLEGDTVESLSRRILVEEHCLFPEAIRLFFTGKLKIDGRRVTILP